MGGNMDRARLAGMLVAQGVVDKQPCVQLSATKFIPESAWADLKSHEREFLRCYCAGASAHKAVLVGRSAGRATNMWVIPHDDEIVELAQRDGNPPPKLQRPEGVVYRHMTVPERDVVVYEPLDTAGGGAKLRITKAARTAVDIARLHGVPDAVAAMDGGFRGQSPVGEEMWREELSATIAGLRGKKGIGAAKEALELCSPLSESAFESYFRALLALRGIQVQEQMWIGRKYRVDFLWGKLIIEIDGYVKFEDKPHAEVLSQMRRENWLKEQGYEIIRLFPFEILRDAEGCIRRVLAKKAIADARGPVRVPATRHRP